MALFSGLDREVTKFLVNLNQQNTNKFEFILTRPIDMDSGFLGLLGGVIDNGIDITMSKLYIQRIAFPAGLAFTYERKNNKQYVVGLEYPSQCSITFIEDENGLVRRYLKTWERDVAQPSDSRSLLHTLGAANLESAAFFGGSKANPKEVPEGVVFADRQDLAKRNGMLFLGGSGSLFGTEIIPTYPRMMLYGLGYQNIGELAVSQGSNDALEYTCNFSLDDISVPVLF